MIDNVNDNKTFEDICNCVIFAINDANQDWFLNFLYNKRLYKQRNEILLDTAKGGSLIKNINCSKCTDGWLE